MKEKITLVSQIKELLYEDLDKSEIRQIILGWLPGLSKKEFEDGYSEAFSSL